MIGLFAAAHDLNLEWVIVKGISHFSDDSNTPNESWKSFASIMAASLVSNMLSDSVVFKEWPHYDGMYPPFSVYLLIVNFLSDIFMYLYRKKVVFLVKKVTTDTWTTTNFYNTANLYFPFTL